MRRRLFTALSSLSLLLCVATCAPWARGKNAWGEFSAATKYGRFCQLKVGERLSFAVVRDWPRKEPLSWTSYRGATPWVEMPANAPWAPSSQPTFLDRGEAEIIVWSDGKVVRTNKLEISGDIRTLLTSYWRISLPYPILVLLFAVAPLASLAVMAIRRLKLARQTAGLCSRCGYDLRATPERCPECGSTTDKQNFE